MATCTAVKTETTYRLELSEKEAGFLLDVLMHVNFERVQMAEDLYNVILDAGAERTYDDFTWDKMDGLLVPVDDE